MTNRKVRLRLGYLAWTLFLAATLAPSVSYSDSVDPTTAKILRDIEECKMLASVKVSLPGEWKHDSRAGGVWVPPRIGIPDRNRNRIELVMSSIYAEYNRKISSPGYERTCIMTSVSPSDLELTYKEWEVSKKLQVLHELIVFGRVLKDNKIYVGPVFQEGGFGYRLIEIRDSSKQLADEADKPANANNKINMLKVAYWRLRFIEPVVGVKEMLSSIENKIEVASIKNELRVSIDKGVTSTELEQRIAKLSGDDKENIEKLRNELLDEKTKQLAIAKGEEAKKEEALRKQQEINQAIKSRKQEIDTGKSDPALHQQLDSNSELKSAVALWESQYRKELADRKAWEAKKKLEDLQLAKAEEARRKELTAAEEARRREAEIAERRRKDEENRIRAKLIRYNVKAEVSGYDLHSNPFTYESQSLLIKLRFDRMIERTVGVFTSGGHEILVSKLPTDLFTSAGQFADLIVKVKGTAEVTNLLGVRFKVPHVEYIDILQ